MVRVSLFQFQDIITCVSGSLIMITLLLTTMVDDNHDTTENTATDEESKEAAVSEQALRDLNANNAVLQAQWEATADPSMVKAETATLAERLRVIAPNLETIKNSRAAQEEAIKNKEKTAGSLEKERDALAAAVQALEKEVKDKQASLVENANTWWLVPKLSANSKIPVLVVVSEKSVTVDEFNKPQARMTLDGARVGAAFVELIRKYNPAVQYIVFFVKPSGIANFVTLKDQAQKAGFQVGFEAMLEAVALNFFKPPN